MKIVPILAALLCITSVAVKATTQYPPEIIFSPYSQFKPRSTVTLLCRVHQDEDINSVQYTRNGKLLSPTLDKRIKRGKEFTLVISSLDHTVDDGEYRCIVQTNRGRVRSMKKILRVKKLGSFKTGFQYTDLVKTIDVVVGRGYTLNCPSASYTYPRKVLWGHVPQSGQPVILGEDSRRYTLANGNLMFTYLMESDIKEINERLKGISCIFYHNGPYVQSVRYVFRKVAELFNKYSPTFTERFANKVKGNEGTETQLACSAYGRPTPTIKWTGPFGEIDSTNTDYRISPSGNILSIPVVFPRLAGQYRCDVSNSEGKTFAQGELSVNALLKWDQSMKDVKSPANKDVTFTVKAIGSNTIEYKWYRNGQRISTSNKTYSIAGNTLTVKDVQQNDYSYIQVFASNGVHEISSTAFLNIDGAVIPKDKEKKDMFSKEYFILIGVASLIILGLIGFIIFVYCK